jgi:hypothetical protein
LSNGSEQFSACLGKSRLAASSRSSAFVKTVSSARAGIKTAKDRTDAKELLEHDKNSAMIFGCTPEQPIPANPMKTKLAAISAAVISLLAAAPAAQAGEPVYKRVRTQSGHTVLMRVNGVAGVRTSKGTWYYRTGANISYSPCYDSYGGYGAGYGGFAHGGRGGFPQRYSLPGVQSVYGNIPRNFAASPNQRVEFRNYSYFMPGAYAAPVPRGIPAAAHGNHVHLGSKR